MAKAFEDQASGRGGSARQPLVRPWAEWMFIGGMVAPWVAHLAFGEPLYRSMSWAALGLAAASALSWGVPPCRRWVYAPDAHARGGAEHAVAVTLGLLALAATWQVVLPLFGQSGPALCP